MANHQQHLTFSSLSGLAFGTLAWYPCGFPAVTCVLAGSLCSVGGMLPDIDIKTSRSFQDCMSITAYIASMLVILRASTMDVTVEMLSIIGAAVFIAVKYGIGNLIQTFTVHRGMIHSIPFAVLCGEILFLTTAGDTSIRILKAAGLSLGFLSHLLLDEIYSVDVVKLNTKKSFGTALKFGMWKNLKLTVTLYFLLFCATFISFKEPNMVGEGVDHALDHIAAMTIHGTHQFEAASQIAQQRLRSGTNTKNIATNNTSSDESETLQRESPQEPDGREPRQYVMPIVAMAQPDPPPTQQYDMPPFSPIPPPVTVAMNSPPITANPQGYIPRPALPDERPMSGNATSLSPATPLPPIRRPAFPGEL